MKKSAKAAAVLAMLAMLVGVAGCGGDTKQAGKDKTCNVGILQLVEHPALDAANKGFVDGLKSRALKKGRTSNSTGRMPRETSPISRPSPSVSSATR